MSGCNSKSDKEMQRSMGYQPNPEDPDVKRFREELQRRKERGDSFAPAPSRMKPSFDRRAEGGRFFQSVRAGWRWDAED